ncbi:MAG: hypothetical protein ACJ8AW_44810 [Rhodopila sp.]
MISVRYRYGKARRVGIAFLAVNVARRHACSGSRHGTPQRQGGIGRLAEPFGHDGGPERQDRRAVDLDWHIQSDTSILRTLIGMKIISRSTMPSAGTQSARRRDRSCSVVCGVVALSDLDVGDAQHEASMFVRWHQNANTGRLTANLAEGHRIEGKVRQTHVIALGSVPRDASAADRFDFWADLHGRLARLDNRLDAKEREAIYAAIHVRIPMPPSDEQHADRAQRAKKAAGQWAAIADGQAEALEGKRQMLAALQRQIDDLIPVAAAARAKATAASERAAAFERGDDPGGTDRPLTRADIKRITGWTDADLQHCERVALIDQLGGFEEFVAATARPPRSQERAGSRKFLRRLVSKTASSI